MRKANRLGCMTLPAIIATVFTLLVLAGSVFATGSAFFSPGDLSGRTGSPLGNVRSHAQIALNCEQCHAALWDTDTMQDRCVRCHTNIGAELADPHKLHGILLGTDTVLECRKCHPEHRGVGASLTDVTLHDFPHELLGFATTSHKILPDGSPFICQNCHVTDYKSFKISDCAACHSKIDATFMTAHTQKYGADCLACHDGKESINKKFDHSKTGFILVDIHSTLDCASCHSKARTLADFKNSAAKCSDCHLKDNPHGDKFGTTCDACHTQKSWKDAHFDHAVTGFKLVGKHENLACAGCHTVPDQYKNTPTTCVGCHQKDDKHAGTEGSACETCHTSDGWKPSTFNHFNVFKLDGKHATVLCQNCHTTPFQFKNAPSDCVGCHQKDDAHKGGLGTDCSTCHNTTAWKPASFDHNLAGFKLTGAHVNVQCTLCHINGKFKGTPMTCVGCHTPNDVHKGAEGTACESCHTTTAWKPSTFNHFNVFKLDGKHATLLCQNCHTTPNQYKNAPTTCFGCHQKDDAHSGGLGTSCSTCHNTTAWKPASFDHNQAAFKLTGAHVTVQCVLCHINGKFKGTPMTCVGCHTANDVHKGAEGTACESCHATAAWKPSTFNHFNVFKLDGKHATLLCASCHTTPNQYKNAPMTCVGCHLKDDNHKGGLGTNCSTCHNTTAWKPASFDHNLSAFKLTGAHVTVQCALCHINGKFKGTPLTCVGCHTATDVHKGTEGTACESCHTTAAWKPSTFNHFNVFKLDGKHATLLCASCHTTPNQYKNAPMTCVGCHLKDDNHKGGLGTICSTCHNTTAWKPATFDHNLAAFKLTGAHLTVQCALCHINGKLKGTPMTCVGCHTSNDVHKGAEGTACETCHTTTAWKPSTFNHFNVFKLDGKHATLLCTNCHTTPNQYNSAPVTCFGCHQKDDAHSGGLGTVCSTCHNSAAWKPASFDHNLSAFKLTGAHVTVTCALCHINGKFKGTPMTCVGCHQKDDKHAGTEGTACDTCHTTTVWKPSTFNHFNVFKLDGAHAALLCANCHTTPFQFKNAPMTCVGCHQKNDIHAGVFGATCSACHTTTAWKIANFDHNQFPFKLTGAHISLQCTQCHTNSNFKSTPTTCVSCHLAKDVHKGTEGTACETCHTTTVWKPSTFNHANAAFKLTGAHVSVLCANCHTTPGKFKGTPLTCLGCHQSKDVHAGTEGTACETCHTTTIWKPSTFNHANAAFKLTGAHVTVLCAKCHTIAGKFKGTPMTCVACHLAKDVHVGTEGTACETCHTTTVWKPSTFNHNTVFTLVGAHVGLACAKCHLAAPKFNNTPMTCVGCHSGKDVHGGTEGTACETCHTTTVWKPSTFNHANAAFKLTGAHVSVLCANCHTTPGKFKGTPSTCFACHQKDDHHAGTFGTSCGTCHSTTAWLPSTFDHNLSAFKLTGAHTAVACSSCHINGVFKGTPLTCVGCHLKNDVHANGEGPACANCHTTAAWKPSTFNHSTVFTLVGAHTSVTCAKCHLTAPKFNNTPTTCFGCHASNDVHKTTEGTACESCHTSTAWKPSTFNHNNAAFKLTGAHVSTLCALCHTTPSIFKGTTSSCGTCHQKDDHHAGAYGTNCGTCHSTTNWQGATFDHNLSAFKLTGKHTSVACASCHIGGVFKGTPMTCIACHSGKDVHGGTEGKACENCHTTSGWKPSTFNHNNAAFKLTGAHTSVACATCHTTSGQFKGTPSACVSCHADPKWHLGSFGNTCASCHTTTNWTATYSGSHPTVSSGDGGKGVNHGHTDCKTCHTIDIHAAICTACHKNGPPGG